MANQLNATLWGMLPAGVITGDDLLTVMRFCRDNSFALPAVNCVGSNSVLACLEAAREAKTPVIIQFSAGGGAFFGGKGLNNKKLAGAIAGTIAGAKFVREIAPKYGVPVVLHSDHCAKKLLPWFDGMLEADEAHYAAHGEPLFSSHMLDLSEEDLKENVEICKKYLKRMHAVDCLLEMELGITGGEEDGVDNTSVDNKLLYTQPEEIWYVYRELASVSHRFSIAASFGNVHGVYKPGNVQLRPEILGNAQRFIAQKIGSKHPKPVFFVFHGGSGSEKDKIALAIRNGVVKMNMDTDTQWAFWNGVRAFEKKNRARLQGQIGNPDGPDKPNKKFYDPRKWLRAGEVSMKKRVLEAFRDLDSMNRMDQALHLVAKL